MIKHNLPLVRGWFTVAIQVRAPPQLQLWPLHWPPKQKRHCFLRTRKSEFEYAAALYADSNLYTTRQKMLYRRSKVVSTGEIAYFTEYFTQLLYTAVCVFWCKHVNNALQVQSVRLTECIDNTDEFDNRASSIAGKCWQAWDSWMNAWLQLMSQTM